MRIYANNLDDDAAHRLLKGCVVPRPIAWISTMGENGVTNAAPFSCFTFVATYPPMVAVSIAPRAGKKKDTLMNIEHNGDFVINVVHEDQAIAVNATSAEYPAEVSEFTAAGLTPVAGEMVKAPRIAECPIQMECRLEQIVLLGASNHSLVIASVLMFHIEERLYREGEIDQAALRALARLAGDQYAQIGKIFELSRRGNLL